MDTGPGAGSKVSTAHAGICSGGQRSRIACIGVPCHKSEVPLICSGSGGGGGASAGRSRVIPAATVKMAPTRAAQTAIVGVTLVSRSGGSSVSRWFNPRIRSQGRIGLLHQLHWVHAELGLHNIETLGTKFLELIFTHRGKGNRASAPALFAGELVDWCWLDIV